MATKIFISFRFSDGHKYKEELEEYFKNNEYIINCSEDEDRSTMSDETIKSYLYDKLSQTSVTIFIVTPESLNHIKKQNKYDDWIYDELRYSLEDREGNRSNGLIAVYTDEVKDLLIKENKHKCIICREEKAVDTVLDVDNLFRKNMMNIKDEYKLNKCEGVYDRDHDSYCSLISWNDFIRNPSSYIESAKEKRNQIDEYNLIKRLQ